MKNVVVGAVTAVTLFAMGMSIVGCNLGGRNKGEKISADSTWYDTDIYKINLGIDTSKNVDQSYAWIAGMDDENMVVLSKGRYQMPDTVRSLEEANPYVIAQVSVIDRKNCTTIKNIDLKGEITAADDINSAELEDGKLVIKVSSYDSKTYSVKTTEKVLDLASGKVTDTRDFSLGMEFSADKTFKLGEYDVDSVGMWTENGSSYMLVIYSPENEMKKVELKVGGADVYQIPLMLPLSETTALVVANTSSGIKFYDLDLKEGKLKEADPDEYSWIEADDLRDTKTVNGEIFYSTSIGLFKIDMEKKATEKVVDFGSCDVNRSLLSSLEITENKDGTYVFCGQKNYGNRYDANLAATEFYIVKLSKAAKNPHAGKTVLDLYAPYGQIDETINDAILKFNKTNGRYFIEVTNKYTSVSDFDFSDVDSEDEYENVTLDKDAKMSSKLAMDIINGEGPDILMNTSSYGQLNNDSYLVDLSSYFGNLDENKYFTNLIEASKTNGKLYQLPVCYTLEGIFTDKKNAGASGVGLTIEEYKEFKSGPLNGQDLITSGQAHYFARLFSSMSDQFIKNGKADFSSDEFKVLADYVKDNIPEKAPSWSSDEGIEKSTVADCISCYAMLGYFYELSELKGDITVLGIPSTDGRGPMFEAYTSLAVSSQASNVDACIEFLKMILSDEVQENLAMQENYVLNREAFRKGGLSAVEYYNGPAGDMMFGFNHMTGEPLKNRVKFSEKDIDKLESVILSCSTLHTEDQAINIILIEEMPAYFLGQKDLESVVKITEDRVQKVLDERK